MLLLQVGKAANNKNVGESADYTQLQIYLNQISAFKPDKRTGSPENAVNAVKEFKYKLTFYLFRLQNRLNHKLVYTTAVAYEASKKTNERIVVEAQAGAPQLSQDMSLANETVPVEQKKSPFLS